MAYQNVWLNLYSSAPFMFSAYNIFFFIFTLKYNWSLNNISLIWLVSMFMSYFICSNTKSKRKKKHIFGYKNKCDETGQSDHQTVPYSSKFFYTIFIYTVCFSSVSLFISIRVTLYLYYIMYYKWDCHEDFVSIFSFLFFFFIYFYYCWCDGIHSMVCNCKRKSILFTFRMFIPINVKEVLCTSIFYLHILLDI